MHSPAQLHAVLVVVSQAAVLGVASPLSVRDIAAVFEAINE